MIEKRLYDTLDDDDDDNDNDDGDDDDDDRIEKVYLEKSLHL
jgi:hypothetical protein